MSTSPGGPRVLAYGESALLVDLADLAEVRALDARLRADPPPGTLDLVPAARSVLVRFTPGTPAGDVERHVRAAWEHVLGPPRAAGDVPASVVPGSVVPGSAVPRAVVPGDVVPGDVVPGSDVPASDPLADLGVVRIGVHYDGPDLDAVAALTGLTRAEVVARHAGRECVVAFGGFMPGFAYLTGLDPALHVPRRPSPRERVPAGSVAVAGEFTAVYPAATPGGWQVLGRTDVVLFDPSRREPALLTPGARVRFVDLDADDVPEPAPDAPGAGGPSHAPGGRGTPGPSHTPEGQGTPDPPHAPGGRDAAGPPHAPGAAARPGGRTTEPGRVP